MSKMMLSSFLAFAAVVCVVTELSYAGSYFPTGGNYPDAGGPYATAETLPRQYYDSPSADYPSKSGNYPSTDYPQTSGSYPPAKGSYSSPQPVVYPSPVYSAYSQDGGSDKKLRQDLSDVRRDVADKTSFDRILNISLTAIRSKVSASDQFRKELQSKIYPAIEANLKKTDDKIAHMKAQLDELRSLSDLVDQLTAAITELESDLRKIRDNRERILSRITKLENIDTDQSSAITSLGARVESQGDILREIEDDQANNLERIETITKNLVKVVDIVNKEKAETFMLYLSSENKTLNFTYATPFVQAPTLVYSVITFHYEKNPEKYISGYDQGGKDSGSGYEKDGKDSGSGYEKGGKDSGSGYEKGGKDSGSGYEKGGKDSGSGYEKGGKDSGSGYEKGGKDSGSGYEKGGKDSGSGYEKGGKDSGSGYEKGGKDSGSGYEKDGKDSGSGYEKGGKDSGSGYEKGGKDSGSGYEKDGKEETLSARVKVTGDAYGGSVTLIDNSNGWTTSFAIVRLTAFIKDNSILTYEENKNSKSY